MPFLSALLMVYYIALVLHQRKLIQQIKTQTMVTWSVERLDECAVRDDDTTLVRMVLRARNLNPHTQCQIRVKESSILTEESSHLEDQPQRCSFSGLHQTTFHLGNDAENEEEGIFAVTLAGLPSARHVGSRGYITSVRVTYFLTPIDPEGKVRYPTRGPYTHWIPCVWIIPGVK